MLNRRWLMPFVLAVACVAAGRNVHAQTIRIDPETGRPVTPEVDKRSQSHIHIPPATMPGQAEEFLAQRLGKARDQAKGQKLLQDILKDPEKFGVSKEEIERLKQSGVRLNPNDPRLFDPNDPNSARIREQVQKWLEAQQGQPGDDPDRPRLKLDAKDLESLRKLIGEMPSQPPQPGGSPIQPNPGGPPPMPPGGMSTPPTPGAGPTPSPQPNPAQSHKQADTTQRLAKWLERFKDNKTLRDSPTVRQMARDLARSSLGGNGDSERSNRLPRFGDYFRPDIADSRWAPSFRNIDWPTAPRFNALPSLGNPSMAATSGGGSEIGRGLLWLMMVVGVVVLFVWALAWRRGKTARQRERGWVLGPWPVSPAAVRTRDELVKAFEHLALLLLGPAARHWHHREIAARLSDATTDDRRRAADHLAGLYEQARYAPLSDPLPAEQIDGARRDLCFLAGVAAA